MLIYHYLNHQKISALEDIAENEATLKYTNDAGDMYTWLHTVKKDLPKIKKIKQYVKFEEKTIPIPVCEFVLYEDILVYLLHTVNQSEDAIMEMETNSLEIDVNNDLTYIFEIELY